MSDPTARIQELENAIREHRDQKGDDRCFLDDDKLYAVLGEELPDTSLPPKSVFLKNCEHYWECRQRPEVGYATDNRGWVSAEEHQKQLLKVQTLTQCLERIKERVSERDPDTVPVIEDMLR